MKTLLKVLLFLGIMYYGTILSAASLVIIKSSLKREKIQQTYTLHHHPSEIQLFDKWEVVVEGDSVCYSGSLSDCAAWVEMKEKGMMK